MSLKDSKFSMWRTVVSLSHADGIFHHSEKEYLMSIFEALNLSEDQMKILKADILEPKDPKVMFKGITFPPDRSQLFYFSRILLWADGEFSASEEESLNRLRELTLDKVDFEKVMKRVEKVATDYEAKEAEEKSKRPMHRKIIDAIVFWEDLP